MYDVWLTGIGKSMFGYYLLYLWCKQGKRVVVRKEGFNQNKPILFCETGAYVLSESDFDVEMNNPDVM
jgi:hypothetical protein